MVTPYTIIESHVDYEIRDFSNFSEKDLFWHRDKEDRNVELLEGKIEIQLDNSLPLNMEKGIKYFIPKNTFHRVISKDPFKVKIYFIGEK